MKSFGKYFVLGALMALPVLGLAGGSPFGPDACSFPGCCPGCSACHVRKCCDTGCNGGCTGAALQTCLTDCAACFP